MAGDRICNCAAYPQAHQEGGGLCQMPEWCSQSQNSYSWEDCWFSWDNVCWQHGAADQDFWESETLSAAERNRSLAGGGGMYDPTMQSNFPPEQEPEYPPDWWVNRKENNMHIDTMFPSRFISGQDLQGKTYTVTIKEIRLESMRPNGGGEVEKWVLFFTDAKKGLVLGKTLAHQIAQVMGSPETDDWIGRSLELFPQPMKVGGKDVVAVRARAPRPQPVIEDEL